MNGDIKMVILAGGHGTRLWPMSTKEQPKQFQALVSEKTMLQETYERIAFVGPENVYVATNAEYTHLVRKQLPQIPEENLIAEPAMRDTAPCIGLAAAIIAKRDPEAVMVSVSADHLIKNTAEFEEKIRLACKLARQSSTLNIIEVIAKEPLTNLGYVEIGPELEPGVHSLKGFKEKPDLETAKSFLASGSYLWNTGYYVWKASRILEEFAIHMPETYARLMAIQSGEPLEEHYPQCEKISIDFGIMEKVDPDSVRIIPADLGWSDIGTWSSLYQELASPGENLTKGNVNAVECEGCLLYNTITKPLTAFGLMNTIIVQTEDNTLVCPMDRSTDLKHATPSLNKKTTNGN